MYRKVSELRKILGHVAKDDGRKQRGGKWKKWNPGYWETKFGLIDMSKAYYQRRKQLYAALYAHPINALT